MHRKRLGQTDLMVSDFCLGCMGYGDPQHGQHTWTLDYEQTLPILKEAIEAGINFFDTAPVYSDGDSEAYIGRALKELQIPRDEVVIATKFFPRSEEERKNGVSMKEHIEQSLNASLERLQTDHVDLYILHMWDYNTPIEETLNALNDLVQQKKIKSIGISNAFAWQVAYANTLAKERGWTPFASIQGHYNLIFREEEREMNPYARFTNMAITPYSSLAGGRLSKIHEAGTKRAEEDTYAKFKYDKTRDEDQVIIDRVALIADKYNVSMSAIALAWLKEKGAIPIAGATKSHHIDAMKEAASLVLSPEDIQFLEELYVPHRLVGVMAQNAESSSPFSAGKDLKHLEK